MQDAPAVADVYRSRETALKAPAASVSAVKLWHLLAGHGGRGMAQGAAAARAGRERNRRAGGGRAAGKCGAFQEIPLLFGE